MKMGHKLRRFCFSSDLTWRDMNHIIVQTARADGLRANDWVVNGAKRKGKCDLNCRTCVNIHVLALIGMHSELYNV